MIGFHFSWIGGCCVHFIERWGQICHELKKYLFRFLVVLEVLQGASGLKICQVAKLLNLFREQPPSENEGMWTFSKKKKQYPVKLGGRKRPLVLNVDLAADLDLDLAAGLKEAQPCPTAHILKHPLLYSSHKYVWNIFETDKYHIYIYDHILAQQLLYYMEARGYLRARFLVIFSQIWPNIILSSGNIYCWFNCDTNELLRAINVLFILPENWNGKEIMQILNGFTGEW